LRTLTNERASRNRIISRIRFWRNGRKTIEERVKTCKKSSTDRIRMATGNERVYKTNGASTRKSVREIQLRYIIVMGLKTMMNRSKNDSERRLYDLLYNQRVR